MESLREFGARGYRLARRLGHMLVAFIFFVMAGVGVFVSFEEWAAHREAPADDWVRLSIFAGFTIFLIIMGLISFLRARGVR